VSVSYLSFDKAELSVYFIVECMYVQPIIILTQTTNCSVSRPKL